MEENETHKDIELKSEEVQEVMNHIPSSILRYGISVLLGILLVLLVGSSFFSYPDTVDAEFTLTTQAPPAYIIANTAGRIAQLYVKNKQVIYEKDIIGVIQNTATTEDIFYLRENLKEWKAQGSQIEQTDILFSIESLSWEIHKPLIPPACLLGIIICNTCRKAEFMKRNF